MSPELIGLAMLVLILGFVSGLTGLGGGSLLTPVLFFFYYSHLPSMAAGTASLGILPGVFLMFGYRYGRNSFRLTLNLCVLASLMSLGAFFGAAFTKQVSSTQGGWILFVILLIMGLSMVYKAYKMHQEVQKTEKLLDLIWSESIICGGVIGFISGLTGLGGGSLLVPYLIWRDIGSERAAGMASFCMVPVVAVTFGAYCNQGNVESEKAHLLLIPFALGTFLGMINAQYIKEKLGSVIRWNHGISLEKSGEIMFSIILCIILVVVALLTLSRVYS
jgi:uncharacterized membrane protein YfcA